MDSLPTARQLANQLINITQKAVQMLPFLLSINQASANFIQKNSNPTDVFLIQDIEHNNDCTTAINSQQQSITPIKPIQMREIAQQTIPRNSARYLSLKDKQRLS